MSSTINLTREQQLKEIREAIEAGQKTLRYLEEARANLNSASNFGIADMLGFDLIGGIGKHVKIQRAQEQLALAKQQVTSFQRELADVQGVLNFQVNIGDFLTFADFFFDGILADVFVQSKIDDAKQQVDSAGYQVQHILEDLNRMEQELL